MLRPMFGMGGTEILVILIVALLFLGPDKLPQAAKTISKGIRDIKKQSRVLQRTIEDDEHIGGAIRDLRSALRGEDEPYRPPPRKELEASSEPTEGASEPAPDGASADAASPDAIADATTADATTADATTADATTADATTADASSAAEDAHVANGAGANAPALTLPPTAGEPADDAPPPSAEADAELASLVKPAPNTIAHTPRPVGEPRKHG
jgi:sec-independent protein translocase protein TatB